MSGMDPYRYQQSDSPGGPWEDFVGIPTKPHVRRVQTVAVVPPGVPVTFEPMPDTPHVVINPDGTPRVVAPPGNWSFDPDG